jgi:hypothetical protein
VICSQLGEALDCLNLNFGEIEVVKNPNYFCLGFVNLFVILFSSVDATIVE